MNNIPHSKRLAELSGTAGFRFYTSANDEDLGDPLEIETPALNKELRQLRDAVIKMLADFQNQKPFTPPVPQPDIKEEAGFTIYMGDVAEFLGWVRNQIIKELEKRV